MARRAIGNQSAGKLTRPRPVLDQPRTTDERLDDQRFEAGFGRIRGTAVPAVNY
jgi:hypothetical protein